MPFRSEGDIMDSLIEINKGPLSTPYSPSRQPSRKGVHTFGWPTQGMFLQLYDGEQRNIGLYEPYYRHFSPRSTVLPKLSRTLL